MRRRDFYFRLLIREGGYPGLQRANRRIDVVKEGRRWRVLILGREMEQFNRRLNGVRNLERIALAYAKWGIRGRSSPKRLHGKDTIPRLEGGIEMPKREELRLSR